jgi:hypothetical protein
MTRQSLGGSVFQGGALEQDDKSGCQSPREACGFGTVG